MPFPGLPANASFNPFQQVCNRHLGQKHPDWSWKKNVGPLDKGIPNNITRKGVLTNLDRINLALVDLLAKRWSGTLGMFQVFAADYLVDPNEGVWLLELNEQPAFTRMENVWPNPWPDILRIQWEILTTLGSVDERQEASTKLKKLKESFKGMNMEYLRMLRVGNEHESVPT